jgi:hypothetical protein
MCRLHARVELLCQKFQMVISTSSYHFSHPKYKASFPIYQNFLTASNPLHHPLFTFTYTIMRSQQQILLSTFLVLSVLAQIAKAAQICSLCGNTAQLPRRWDYILKMSSGVPYTCRNAYFDVSQCIMIQKRRPAMSISSS